MYWVELGEHNKCLSKQFFSHFADDCCTSLLEVYVSWINTLENIFFFADVNGMWLGVFERLFHAKHKSELKSCLSRYVFGWNFLFSLTENNGQVHKCTHFVRECATTDTTTLKSAQGFKVRSDWIWIDRGRKGKWRSSIWDIF